MPLKTRYFLICLLVAFPLDQASKYWIIDRLHYGERLTVVPGFFDLTHVRNPGGAFSFLADAAPEYRMVFFIGTTFLAIGLLLVFYRRLEPDMRLSALALGTILGGALGNLVDRLVYGEVIDFLEVHLTATYTWPTFNLADSFIVVGVALLMLEIFFEESEEPLESEERGRSPEAAGSSG